MAMAPSTSSSNPRIQWPEGKRFAFTVFDDPDFQTVDRGKPVYDFLADLGFRTTRGVFPGTRLTPAAERNVTCLDDAHRQWLISLHERGFEMGWHGASPGTSKREQTEEALGRFREMFGAWPKTISQHYECKENIYWGDNRLSEPSHRFVYNLLTRWKNHNAFFGDKAGHELYWSDLCRERVRYVRSFVFSDMNTLAACPYMPYRDPDRPDVNLFYSSTGGHNAAKFIEALSEARQDQLEAEGGACIMYTHFAYQFVENGKLLPEFRRLMERLARKSGWFVPLGTLLDYLGQQKGIRTITAAERKALERRWLVHKVRYGTA
jgi:hypothetical protein